jgi:hypothetical protein
LAYGVFSLVLYVIILIVIALFMYSDSPPPWMTVADMMTDICRSRAFTAASFTWLLYAFYVLQVEYFANGDSVGTFSTHIFFIRDICV